MCVPLPHEQDTNSADTAYGIACLTILADRVNIRLAVIPTIFAYSKAWGLQR